MGVKSSSLSSLANELKEQEQEQEQEQEENNKKNDSNNYSLRIEREKSNCIPFNCPRFNYNEKEQIKEYFNENGYVVIKEVANQEEIETAKQLYWNFLEKEANMKENEIKTWKDENFVKIGSTRNGILFYNGIQHSDVLWYIRCLPKVKKSFEHIYNTNNLIVSYDGGSIFRPWHLPESDTYTKTHPGWYHVDQGRLLPGFHCCQGLVTLTDVNETTGGFCCIPKSHNFHDELIQLDKSRNPERNYIPMPNNFQSIFNTSPEILPLCNAGDLILWDSRTIHCNTPSLVEPSQEFKSLLRMVCYVCMTPTSFATPEILNQKVQLFEYSMPTNHWPHLFNGMNVEEVIKGKEKKKNIDDIPAYQRHLIQGGVDEI